MFENILVAVDGSEYSPHGSDRDRNLLKFGAEVFVLHVHEHDLDRPRHA